MTTTPPVPALTPHTDALPCPRIEVLTSPMPVDAVTYTIWRNYSNQVVLVRAASGIDAADELVIDYEAPLGVPVTYTAMTFDINGIASQLTAPSAAVTLAVAEGWLQDPLDPSASMPIAMARPGAAVMQTAAMKGYVYDVTTALTTPLSSPLPVGFSSVRRAPSAIPLEVRTTIAGGTSLLAILNQAQPVCLRLPTVIPRLAPVMYLQIGALVPNDYPALDTTVWTFTGDSVLGPGLSIIIAVRTLNDVNAEATTLDGLSLLYATMNNVARGS